MICILAGMFEEIKPLIQYLNNIKKIVGMDRNFLQGNYGEITVILGVTGCGNINGAITTQYVLNQFGIEKVYYIGTAGSLGNVEKGTVHKIGNVSCDLEGYKVIELRDCRKGKSLLSSSHEISSITEKNKLNSLGYDLVDMEGYGVAYVCKIFQIECEIIKVVSDCADENFNVDFKKCIESYIHLPIDLLLSELV